jgi:hypothetical protein
MNIGNTCYLNSTLQIISHIPELNFYLKQNKEYNDVVDKILTQEWIALYDLIWSKNCIISPNRFVHYVKELSIDVVDGNGNRVWDLTKHINGKGSSVGQALSGSANALTNTEISRATPEPPSLDQEKYDAMVKFITEGKIKEVESAMKKYKLNDSQKKLLTAMINQHKAEAVTKSAKK